LQERNAEQHRRLALTPTGTTGEDRPTGSLSGGTADDAWQPALLARIKDLLVRLDTKFGLAPAANLGSKLSKRALPNAPFVAAADLAGGQDTRIRIDTVHQVKGESLDAVLYIAKKGHVQAMINGIDTELGRIGYVAVTGAKDVFWLGVPASALTKFRGPLIALGFRERGAPAGCTTCKPELVGTAQATASDTLPQPRREQPHERRQSDRSKSSAPLRAVAACLRIRTQAVPTHWRFDRASELDTLDAIRYLQDIQSQEVIP
jgi:hypothetical protein